MERNGVGMISLNYSASDFLNLNLDVSSDERDWNSAIRMFEDRFNERYFDPIDLLINNPEKNGFAIMAINCLMVDAFYQFKHGDNTVDKNTRKYTSFLLKEFKHIIIDQDMALKFYKHIRCGILHSAQTKDGSMLSTECENAVEYFKGKACIKVNVVKFTAEMKNYFYDYTQRLKTGDAKLRTNFITKMNYVCIL